jgi:predicted RND superfamily exporter protein
VRLDLERFEQRFAQNNNLLFVLTMPGDDIFSAEGLALVDAVTQRAWQLPYASRVDSITNFPLINSEDDSFGVQPMRDGGLPQTPTAIEAARAAVMADPWIAGLLVDEQGTVTGINVLFILPPEATQEIAEISAAVSALETATQADYPQADIHVTGNVALMNAFADSAQRDLSFLIPLALILVVAIAFAFLRDIALVGAVGVYLLLCCAGAMGAAGWAGYILNPATVASPIIIMTLGLASVIHFISGIQAAIAQNRTVPDAVNVALSENRFPIAVTIATTAFGFICMNAAASPPLRELGNIVVVGLLIALGLALFVMPPILRRLPIKARAMPSRKVLSGLIGRIVARRRTVVLVTALAAIGAASGIGQIKRDDDFIRYFDHSFDYRVASDFAEDRLTGLNLLEFAFEAGEPHGINDPAYMARLDAFADWLRQQPGVAHVTSLSDKLRQIHEALNPDAAPGAMPDRRDQVAQYLLLFELSLPPGSDIADRINAERGATRVTAAMRHVTSADIRALNARAAEWLAQNNPVPGQEAGHSINYFFAALSLNNINAMIGGTVLALVLISFIVLVALQDVRLGAISLISNVLPLLVGFGLWGFIVGEIGLASSVVAAMTFGIVVDDTIHLLLRFKRARMAGHQPEAAMRLAFVDVGRAIMITSLALIGGFLLLTFSGFEINASLGLFISIIVLCALVIVLTLVPALVLMMFKPDREPETIEIRRSAP